MEINKITFIVIILTTIFITYIITIFTGDCNIKYKMWSLTPRYLYEALAVFFICIVIYLFKTSQDNNSFQQIVLFLFIMLNNLFLSNLMLLFSLRISGKII